MDPATMALASKLLEEKQMQDEQYKDMINKNLSTVANTAGLGGDILVASANMPDNQPDVKSAAIGGAMSGAAKGFQSGGIFGAIAGAVGGAGTAALSTAQARQDFEETKKRDFESMMEDSTRLPFVGYAEEGGVAGLEVTAELIPIQAEVGENTMLADYSIVDVKAKSKHEEMEKGQITDLFPKGTIIFSDDEEGDLIKRSDISEESNLIAYQPVYYEDGDKSHTGESARVLFTDLYKDGEDELTAAELARRIKKKYPTVKNDKDIFAQETNANNKEARAAYLGRLVMLQEGKKQKKGKPSMSKEYVQEFQGGGRVGFTQDPPDEDEDGNATVLTPIVSTGSDDGAILPSAIVTARRDESVPNIDYPELRPIANNPQVRRNVNAPDLLSPRGLREYVETISADPEQLLKDVADGKVSKSDLNKIRQIGDPEIDAMIDDTFNRLGSRLDQLEKRNLDNKKKQLGKAVNTFRQKRGLNALRFGSAAAGTLLQSNREDPILQTAGNVSERFADVPQTVIAQQENEARSSATSNNQQLEDMGASTSQIMANNAAQNAAIQGALSRTNAQYETQRAQNRARREELLTSVANQNRAAITNARNLQRTNTNQAIADLFSASGNYFERADAINTQQLGYENAVEKEFNANDQVLFNDKFEMESNRLREDIRNSEFERRRQDLNETISSNRENAPTIQTASPNITDFNRLEPPEIPRDDRPVDAIGNSEPINTIGNREDLLRIPDVNPFDDTPGIGVMENDGIPYLPIK